MPPAKPISLFPLSFDEAMDALIRVDPQRVKAAKPKPKPKRKKAKRKTKRKRKK